MHRSASFLSGPIIAGPHTGCFVSSLEADKIPLSPHYGTNCNYPGEKVLLSPGLYSLLLSTPVTPLCEQQQGPTVTCGLKSLSEIPMHAALSEVSHRGVEIVCVQVVFFVCLHQTFSQRGGEEEGLPGDFVTGQSPTWLLSSQ